MNKSRITLLKLVLGIFIMLSISWNLKDKFQLSDAFVVEQIDWQEKGFYLLAVILLMPVNWLLETIKLQTLASVNQELSIFQSAKAVLSGVSVSIFTPNRIGEFAGRVLLFERKYRANLIWSTILGNYSQVIVIVIFGLMGFANFISQLDQNLTTYTRLFMLVNIGILTGLLFIYFNAYAVMKVILRFLPIAGLKRWLLASLYPMKQYRWRTLSLALMLSILRYGIYTFQYYLTLRFFSVNLSMSETITSITSVYLLKTSIPYPPAMGFLMRGEISIWIFQFFTENLAPVIMASATIWLINLMIPALIGYGIIIKEEIKL